MAYITKINLDDAQYSVVPSIKKLNVDGVIYNIGLDTSDANAISSDIKQGKTAYVNGSKLTGSLAPYGPQTITPTTKNQSFGPGVYLNGQITVLGSTALIPGNIKSGVNIFGVVGNLTLESFLPSRSDVLSGNQVNTSISGSPIYISGLSGGTCGMTPSGIQFTTNGFKNATCSFNKHIDSIIFGSIEFEIQYSGQNESLSSYGFCNRLDGNGGWVYSTPFNLVNTNSGRTTVTLNIPKENKSPLYISIFAQHFISLTVLRITLIKR